MRWLCASVAALLVSSAASAAVKVNANISINSTPQTVNCTDARAIVRSLPTSGLPTGQFSFTCNTSGIRYVCEPAQPINYSLPTLTIDVATGNGASPCANGSATGIIVDATIGGSQAICPAASAITYQPSNNQFSYSCGGVPSSCFPTQPTVYDLANRRITVVCGLANPSGTGSATPTTIGRGDTVLIRVTAVPGSNPTSTNLQVSANLTGIDAASNQPLYDDGSHGDVTAGDKVFSFLATVGNNATNGAKSLPISISDGQARVGTTTIPVTVLAPTDPTANGSSSPASIAPTGTTLLTVTPVPGANPVSSGFTVQVDLSSIGGSASQPFYDDGSHGDNTPGDGVFSFFDTTPFNITPGTKSLPVTVTDAQSRTGGGNIPLTVLTPTNPVGVSLFAPDNVGTTGTTVLEVWAVGGKLPNSTGLGVTADLTLVGGNSGVALLDDGLGADVTAGDGIYSASVNVTALLPAKYTVPITVSDAQGRSNASAITADLYVLATGAMSASGIATPNPSSPSATTLLAVTVVPPQSPAQSTGVIVQVDLTSLGGASNAPMYDDGTHGDVTAGDGVFSLSATVPANATPGTKKLSVLVLDDQFHVARTAFGLEVRGNALFSDSFDD